MITENGTPTTEKSQHSTVSALRTALRERGVDGVGRVVFKDNRTRLLSVSRDRRTLYLHRCFAGAPPAVVDAIATLVSARRGSTGTRRAAGVLRTWAAEHAPVPNTTPSPGRCDGTPAQRARLRDRYAELNRTHFGGRLPAVPLRVSRRMRRRLGHVRCHRTEDGRRVVVELAMNASLFDEGNEAAFRETLLHEMAHVEAWLVHGHRGHGAIWKRIALRVGCEPRACTRIELARQTGTR